MRNPFKRIKQIEPVQEIDNTHQQACDVMITFYRANEDMFKSYFSEYREPDERKALIKEIYNRLNYTGNTTINKPRASDVCLYRGIRAETEQDIQQYSKDFSTGEVVFGKKASLHGTGIYMATNEQVALKYATYNANYGAMIKCEMADDIKIANCDQLMKDKETVLALMIKQNADDRNILMYSNLLNDNGVFAAIVGYDAINIPEKEYMLVLNREKLFVDGIDYYRGIELQRQEVAAINTVSQVDLNQTVDTAVTNTNEEFERDL